MENNLNMNNEFENLSKDDFVIVKKEKNIKDTKFETKSTTFARDAFKRFCKNKSSVVAAFIIGILIIMAIVVPIVSPYDCGASDSHPSEILLKPKLFNTSFASWWNGTEKYTNQPVLVNDDGTPSENLYNDKLLERAVVSKSTPSLNYTNTSLAYAKFGYFLANSNYVLSENQEAPNRYYVQTNAKGKFYKNNDITIDFEFGVQDENGNIKDEFKNINGGVLAPYIFYFADDMNTYYFNFDESNNSWKYYENKEDGYSSSYKDCTINVTDVINSIGVNSLESYKFGIEIKLSTVSNAYTIFKTIKFNYPDTLSSTQKDNFDAMSMNDACSKTLLDSSAKGYYQSTCNKQTYQAIYYTVDVVYDKYEDVYGEKVYTTFSKSDLDKYIASGWCSYDYNIGESSFVLLDDKCPVREIYKQNTTVINKGKANESKVYTFKALVSEYRYLGYSKMPKYLFGTDGQGLDLFTKCFKGLRTSFILSFLTATVCFLFGLVWGSISGYFGGNVDLFMERFCDILSGIPWIVVMTLCILHLGNNFGTFVLALCLTGWMGTSSRTRTQFYRFKGREYILASRTLGASDMRLIFKHILPNALGTIITGAVLMIPSCIFSESTLSYLQLGLQGKVSFGTILSKNQQYISSKPLLIVFPSIIISLLMISFNLLGNGLRDAVNPSLKGSD